MDKLLVLTFADAQLPSQNYLRKSCEEFEVDLKVLTCSPWIQNVVKLKLLYEFAGTADPELVLLVVDAYDVVLYDNEEAILDRFHEAEAEILFSGESNFMYKEPAKWLAYLRKYPKQSSIYRFLNSGSYIGKVKHIRTMLDAMQQDFAIDFLDEEKLLPLKSDQYLLSRFFVDSASQPERINLKIDATHQLLGVTGGRFCVVNFPGLSKWQSFAFFIVERNLLKLFSLHRHQKIPKDYAPLRNRFFNKKTGTYPPVMHFPGTWDRFDKVYEGLLVGKTSRKGASWILAAVVSVVAFLASIVATPLFWLVTRK